MHIIYFSCSFLLLISLKNLYKIENSQKSDRSQGLKTDENYEFATPKIQEMLNDSQKAFEYLLNEISSTELNNNLKSLRDKINSKFFHKIIKRNIRNDDVKIKYWV